MVFEVDTNHTFVRSDKPFIEKPPEKEPDYKSFKLKASLTVPSIDTTPPKIIKPSVEVV